MTPLVAQRLAELLEQLTLLIIVTIKKVNESK